MSHTGSSGRGRGRGRGRRRGRGVRTTAREASHHEIESDSCTPLQPSNKPNANPGSVIDTGSESKEMLKENIRANEGGSSEAQNFDLNAELAENEEATAKALAGLAVQKTTAGPTSEAKRDEYPGWSLSDIDKMTIDPLQLVHFSTRLDEDEEDYDEEG